MPRLSISLFGYPQVRVNETPIHMERRKTLALIAYLAVEAAPPSGRGCPRDALAALLWPETSQTQSGAHLRQALWDFSRAAGESWLVKDGPRLSFDPQAELWIDVRRFTDLQRQWRSLAAVQSGNLSPALALLEEIDRLYTGSFLEGFTLRDAPAFDDWQALQSETLRLGLMQALEALAELRLNQGDPEAALATAHRLLGLDPLHESAHRLLMRLYEAAGQRAAALRQYESCCELLQTELGVEPEAETTALANQLRVQPHAERLPVTDSRPPTGTVTFLFTDIEGSTRLWEEHPQAMRLAFAQQESIVRQACERHGGYVYKMIGDAFQAAFSTAPDALATALEVQRLLAAEAWGETGPVRLRMALHTCTTEERGDDYVGPDLNRLGRMLSAAHGGQVLVSQATADLGRGRLADGAALLDLGERRLRDLAYPERIFQLSAPGLPREFPPLRGADLPASRLPLPATPFVGREPELANIAGLLSNPECRLITLVGIGGAGKTRLAVQAARQAESHGGFPGGVYFAALASISACDDLIVAIGEALGESFHSPTGMTLPLDSARAQLLRLLAGKQVLLALDNFEQLMACAPFLAELLEAAPGVKLIVTSRERLNLPGEWAMEVLGLPFPGSEDPHPAQYASAQLFIKGAERAGSFHPTAEDWAAIARICQLLEGMPLGVEMASAWTKMMTCAEIAAEIERDLDFLTAAWRGMPERHRTLRAVFEHSWRLLSENERLILCRLAVFRGGFSREAALEIAQAPLGSLASLADKSLLRRVSSGRFDIHPVLHQYAVQKLSGEAAAQAEAHLRHAVFYTDWIGRMVEKLKGSQQASALAALRLETQNLRLALQHLVQQRDWLRLHRALPSLVVFYEMHNQRVESQEVTRLLGNMVEALSLAGEETPSQPDLASIRADLLAFTLATIRHLVIDYEHIEPSLPYQRESLARAQALPDSPVKAMALILSAVGPGVITPTQTVELCNQSAEIFHHCGDAWGEALAQFTSADAIYFGERDASRARPVYEAALQTFTRLGNDWGRAFCLKGLAMIEFEGHTLEAVQRLGQESLAIFERLGNLARTPELRHILGEIAAEQNRPEQARLYFETNLAFFTRVGDEGRIRYYTERLNLL
jgi:predicted ATPase/DNA-binding SARP family transcriptional activator